MITIRIAILIVASLALVDATPLHDIENIFYGNGMNAPLNFLLPKDNHNQEESESCDQVDPGSFSIWDYTVVIAMLTISCGIGVFYGFFDKGAASSAEDFMLGTEMSVLPVTLSLATSFITAIELLGNPAEIFFNGSQYVLICISMILVIPFAMFVFFPIYDKMKLTSCYEYLGMRFGKQMRIFGALLYIAQMCFYTSVSVLAPAIALSKATGLNTRLAIVLIYVVCIFYSSQGGLKAVVIADTFQTCVLVLSLLMVISVGTYMQDGGIAEIFRIAKENDRLDIANFDPNPTTRHTVFSVVIGGVFYWGSLLCVNQATVQKAMSLRSLSKARIALPLSIVGLMLVFLINFYTGILTYAAYHTCDPLKAGKIDGIDQLMPFYVMESFGHITTFVGIFVAGVFAASLGTVAACLSSLSAVTIEDLLVSGLNIKITAENGTKYAKWMNFGYGVVSFGLIFLVEGRSILQATLTLNGLIGGIILGLFSLGIFFKRANLKGALYGGLLSTVCVVTLGIIALTFGDDTPYLNSSTEECDCEIVDTSVDLDEDVPSREWYQSIYNVSYMWYSMIGTLLTIILGLLISFLTEFYETRQINKLVISAKENEGNEGNDSRYSSRPSIISAQRNSVINDGAVKPHETSVTSIFEKNENFGGIDNPALILDDELRRK